MNIVVNSSIHGIMKIDISELAREGERRKREAIESPLLWVPRKVEDNGIRIEPPPWHDPEGRNRR